jgi:hypothetical protein
MRTQEQVVAMVERVERGGRLMLGAVLLAAGGKVSVPREAFLSVHAISRYEDLENNATIFIATTTEGRNDE